MNLDKLGKLLADTKEALSKAKKLAQYPDEIPIPEGQKEHWEAKDEKRQAGQKKEKSKEDTVATDILAEDRAKKQEKEDREKHGTKEAQKKKIAENIARSEQRVKKMKEFNEQNHKLKDKDKWHGEIPEGYKLDTQYDDEYSGHPMENETIKSLHGQLQDALKRYSGEGDRTPEQTEHIKKLEQMLVRSHNDWHSKREDSGRVRLVPDEEHPVWEQRKKNKEYLDEFERQKTDKVAGVKAWARKYVDPVKVENWMKDHSIEGKHPELKEALSKVPRGYIPEKERKALLSVYSKAHQMHQDTGESSHKSMMKGVINSIGKHAEKYEKHKKISEIADHFGIEAGTGSKVRVKPQKGGMNIIPTADRAQSKQIEEHHKESRREQAAKFDRMVREGYLVQAEGGEGDFAGYNLTDSGKQLKERYESKAQQLKQKPVDLQEYKEKKEQPKPVEAPKPAVPAEPEAPAIEEPKQVVNKSVDPDTPTSIPNDVLIKALMDDGMYQSALELQNWGEKDVVAQQLEKSMLKKAAPTKVKIGSETIQTATEVVSPKQQPKRTGERVMTAGKSTAVKQYTGAQGTAKEQAAKEAKEAKAKSKKQPVKSMKDFSPEEIKAMEDKANRG